MGHCLGGKHYIMISPIFSASITSSQSVERALLEHAYSQKPINASIQERGPPYSFLSTVLIGERKLWRTCNLGHILSLLI